MILIFRSKQYATLVLCCFLYCFTTVCFSQSQTSQTDSTTFQEELQQKSFNELLDTYYKHRMLDSTKAATVIAFLKKNYLIATDENQVTETYLTIASWQKRNDSITEALASLHIGIEKAKRLDNKQLLFEGLNRRGVYLFENGMNDEALSNYLAALEVAKESNDVKNELSAVNNIILLKLQANDNLGAIDLYFENLKRIEQSNDERLQNKIPKIYLGLTKAYINLEIYDKANLYANEGLVISKQMELLSFQAFFSTLLGEIASNNGNFEQAQQLFIKSKELIDKAGGDKVLEIFLKFYVGKNYAMNNQHEKAIAQFLECERRLQASKISYLSIQELYVGLAKSYLALENIVESSNYFKKAYEIDTKNDKTRALLNSRITQDSLNKLKDQIDDLKYRSQLTTYLYISGLVLSVIIIFGLIVYYKKQQRKNKEAFNKLMSEREQRQQQEKLAETSEKSKLKITTTDKKELPEIDEKTAEILKKLAAFETDELFLSQESTLSDVAKKLKTNTTYLSKVINTYKEKSFTSYITDLRVDYAIERLSIDRKFRSFTIGAIAQEIGFKRSESFSKAFKVKTGLYPSYFIKQIEKQ